MYEQMSGIREKIKRAKKHIEDFRAAWLAFKSTEPYSLRIDADTDPSNPVIQVLKADPIPPELMTIAGDAIHNMRSALDHLACALVRANGNVPTIKTEFPILDRPIATAKIGARFAGKVEGMRKEVIDAIRAIEPYQGGDNTLWRLHRFDVIDKHNMLIGALGNITTMDGYPPIGDRWDGNQWLGIGSVPVVLEKGRHFTFPDAKVNNSTKFFAEVVFNQPNVAEGYPMLLALKQFDRCVFKTIGELSWPLK
jgi:hypothetical protein